jgi:hypothetical protein
MSLSRREELIWAAGLFEGEGCFTRNTNGYPKAKIVMTDEDSIRRFCTAVGFGSVHGPVRRRSWKPYWEWRIGGFEKVQALLAMLWPGLGARRRARAIEVLSGAFHRDPARYLCGHSRTDENSYVVLKTDARVCRECSRTKSRERYRRNHPGSRKMVA